MEIDIKDNDNLIPDTSILKDVIQNHPLCGELCDNVRTVLLQKNDKESIEYYPSEKKVILNLNGVSSQQPNYKYILLHEFSHVADKITPEFKYSEELKSSLSDVKKLLVMELWNVYIDSRLNRHGLFMLGNNDANVYGRIKGKIQKFPCTIEGKLLAHISFLASRGFKDAEVVVKDIWDRPQDNISYVDLIQLVKSKINKG